MKKDQKKLIWGKVVQLAKDIEGNQCNPLKEVFIIPIVAKKYFGVDRK